MSDNGKVSIRLATPAIGEEISAIYETIREGVLSFNKPYFGERILKPYVIYATDNSDRVVGGICGNVANRYIIVDWAWVAEACRSQGIGKALMQKLDEYAIAQGVQYIQLDTFDFQARPFYEKLGFVHIGTIPAWVEGRDCYFMRKTLRP